MMTRLPYPRRGYSLLEIMVGLAVFGIVISSAGVVFFRMYSDWARQRDYIRCMQDAYWGLETMATDFRLATSIADQSSGPSFRRFRLQTPYLAAGHYLWYWQGNQDFDNEDNKYGYQGHIYKADSANSNFDPWLGTSAFYFRRVAVRYYNNTTAGIFYQNPTGGTVNQPINLTLSLRPNPDGPVGPRNREFIIRTCVRNRN